MQQVVYAVIGALLMALSVWTFRIIYRDYGKGSQNSPAPLAAAAVLLITVLQLYRAAQEPARTSNWVVLGIGLVSCFLVVLGLSRRKASGS
jgi:hypothetical protein